MIHDNHFFSFLRINETKCAQLVVEVAKSFCDEKQSKGVDA
jgi:hypothetical protein